MARLSDIIEAFIKELINDTGGNIEIQRNELALRFKCVPSQINYVISTRFNVGRGYYVESKRGGGGNIQIKRVDVISKGNYIMHIISEMEDQISQQSAEIFIRNFLDYDVVSPKEALLIRAAISDKVLVNVQMPQREILRANLLKNMLASLMCN